MHWCLIAFLFVTPEDDVLESKHIAVCASYTIFFNNIVILLVNVTNYSDMSGGTGENYENSLSVYSGVTQPGIQIGCLPTKYRHRYRCTNPLVFAFMSIGLQSTEILGESNVHFNCSTETWTRIADGISQYEIA